ncbi:MULTISPECIES: dethiobiotin synthase [unclassified Halomonas]|uniref:dethiobiotin synthase n=1 Tax=unclassified Halomonas TaxID=2609666 RepID=UPI0009905836|nr:MULTISPECIES: dethiobiotin synthase [unclassified Halomonas]AQU83492.1 dethiobiotin synthase [Halomonas sp. 'Soap Lake \
MTAYFVTGTDTDAGKTLATSALLCAARERKLSTLGLKPIASGSLMTPDGLRNSDALALQAQSTPLVEYTTVNPWAFAPAIAPHLAAQEAGVELNMDSIVATLRDTLSNTSRDLTLIEGAGGWRVPLNADEDFSDIPRALQLPVILVVGLKLGCLNHARLTAEVISSDGLTLVGWVGSVVDPGFAADHERFEANIALLKSALAAPCLGVIPHLDSAEAAHAQPYLSLAPLLNAHSLYQEVAL